MFSEEIKEYGLSIGYDKIGITSVDSLSGYADEVISRGDQYSYFLKMLTKPVQQNMPEAKSIIVLVRGYFNYDVPEALSKMIGKIYLARCYSPPLGTLDHSRFQLMKDYLSQKGCMVNSNIFVPARWAAAQAGITTFGRNNFAYADGIGSYIVIDTIVVDAELEYDRPTMENKCPPDCRACINSCPTKALYEPFKLNPSQCIAFNNFMTQDGRGAVSSLIPYELRKSMGCKIHGCDVCQDVCPRNQKKRKQPKEADRYLEQIAPDITLSAILNMSDDYFEKRIRPMMYNYINDKRYFIRNAAIAMGNSQDANYVHDLEIALGNPDAMIRESVVWALGQIGGAYVNHALESRLLRESSDDVKQAIVQALDQSKQYTGEKGGHYAGDDSQG